MNRPTRLSAVAATLVLGTTLALAQTSNPTTPPNPNRGNMTPATPQGDAPKGSPSVAGGDPSQPTVSGQPINKSDTKPRKAKRHKNDGTTGSTDSSSSNSGSGSTSTTPR